VFTPFARAPDAARSKVPGYGLGLHLVELLVRNEGGRVEVASREGEGSHFRAIFPAQRAVARAAVRAPATALLDAHRDFRERPDRGAPPGMTLLVIEDNDALRARLQELLSTEYRVLTAGDGERGLQQAREALPDLIVCDVDLPQRDGFSVCADLKDDPLTSGIPVFFLTAYTGSDHRLLGLRAQGDAYFCKPFAADELRLQIANRLWQQQRLRASMQREFSHGEPVPAQVVVATRDETQLAKARAFHAKVQKLLAKLSETSFIAVVGPSGCGKSSLLRAGMASALADGALPGSRDWRVEFFRPGNHPLRALAVSLAAWLEPV
jgi:DNA-binding response OmpR family regulator